MVDINLQTDKAELMRYPNTTRYNFIIKWKDYGRSSEGFPGTGA